MCAAKEAYPSVGDEDQELLDSFLVEGDSPFAYTDATREDGALQPMEPETELQTQEAEPEISPDEQLRDLIHAALRMPGGNEAVGKMLELAPLSPEVNQKQAMCMIKRRRCKILLQALRALRGDGCHVSQPIHHTRSSHTACARDRPSFHGTRARANDPDADRLDSQNVCQGKHASRQEHARRRVRGPHGRFLGAGEKAEAADLPDGNAESMNDDANSPRVGSTARVTSGSSNRPAPGVPVRNGQRQVRKQRSVQHEATSLRAACPAQAQSTNSYVPNWHQPFPTHVPTCGANGGALGQHPRFSVAAAQSLLPQAQQKHQLPLSSARDDILMQMQLLEERKKSLQRQYEMTKY